MAAVRHDGTAAARYLIGLGSNRCHGRHGRPEHVLEAAIAALENAGLEILAISGTIGTRALGPSGRDFANLAMLVRCTLPPPALLALLKQIERDFGRRRGRRWGPRVLDADILAWSGGAWRDRVLQIPHRHLTERRFALGPAAEIAPLWRHPVMRLTLRQLDARLRRRRPVDRSAPTP